jgi:hypothetical protein
MEVLRAVRVKRDGPKSELCGVGEGGFRQTIAAQFCQGIGTSAFFHAGNSLKPACQRLIS